jgi:hypothetical protein
MAPRVATPPAGPSCIWAIPAARSGAAARREGIATLLRFSCAAGERFVFRHPSVIAKNERDARGAGQAASLQRPPKDRPRVAWNGARKGRNTPSEPAGERLGDAQGMSMRRVLPVRSSSYLGIPAGSPLEVAFGERGRLTLARIRYGY